MHLENVATKIWCLEDCQLEECSGTYAEYEQWQEGREKAAKKAGLPSPGDPNRYPWSSPKAATAPSHHSTHERRRESCPRVWLK